jgi:peptidoglycan-associated lipoprotein
MLARSIHPAHLSSTHLPMNPNINPSSRYSQVIVATLLVLLLLATHGCAHRKGANATGSKFGQEGGQANPFLAGTGNNAGDGLAENVPLSGRPNDVNFDSPKVRKDLFEPVHFAFDRYDLDQNELPKIKRVADYLRSRGSGVIIAGHTDSLGTTEYNRNLGERRALAVRVTLLQYGIDAARVQTLSFGEDRPAQAGNSESANTANRRAEFGLFESVSP